jgi:hypothetical protein
MQGESVSTRIPRLLATSLIAVLMFAPAHVLAREFFGESGGFEVFLTERGECEASRALTYRDADGVEREAAMSFGLLIEQQQLLAVLAMYSQAFELPSGESWRGPIGFDDRAHEAVYVADDRDNVSVYLAPGQIRDIASARLAELTLPGDARIAVPLTGTFAASRLLSDCYRTYLARRIRAADPFLPQ